MKKLLLLAILMLALVFTIAACTGGDTPDDTTVGDTTVETPTDAPTEEPTEEPTDAPTEEPTDAPTEEPTDAPTEEPTDAPTDAPTEPDTEEPTEPETADPADPVWIIDADGLAAMTNANAATVEKNEAGYASFTATGGDPWFLVTGNIGEMPEYMVMRYRTNTTQNAEFFIGNGAGPVGGESFLFNYNANGEWNLLIFHLPTVASYMATPTVGYIRYDFYTGGADEGFLDVEYIAFFNTAEYAQAYDFELHKAPHWTEATDQIKHQSFDQLYTGTGNADNGPENIFTPGASADWDFVVDYSDIAYADFTVDTLTYWGWIGFMGEKGQFGYQIDMNAAVYNDEWAFVGGDHEGIIGAAQGVGADSGHRMKIAISLAGLEGEHTVRAMYKTGAGVEICLNEFTVKLPTRPTHYENYNVPQDLWTVTGHCPGIVGKEGHANSGMVAAGGVESGALIHQGAVSLGEIDLSKYDKAVIMWGCDNSPVTVGHYEQSANNRIMLVSADVSGTAPAEDTIIAGGTYELGGWAVQAFEIDLTEVDYNGPVYLCIDTLPGTFALFASVEFIGAEIDYSAEEPEEPVVPEGPKVIGMKDAGSTVKHISQDGFRYLDGNQNVVEEIVTPGQYSQFDGTLEYTKGGHPCVADFGWVAMNAETFQFGYIINDGEPIMNDAYTTPASDPVKAAAATTGASNCSAFYGVLVVGFLPTGEHNIKFVMQQDGGDYVIIREYTIIVSE